MVRFWVSGPHSFFPQPGSVSCFGVAPGASCRNMSPQNRAPANAAAIPEQSSTKRPLNTGPSSSPVNAMPRSKVRTVPRAVKRMQRLPRGPRCSWPSTANFALPRMSTPPISRPDCIKAIEPCELPRDS